MNKLKWTEQEDEFLRGNYHELSGAELTKQLNRVYEMSRCYRTVLERCNKLGLSKRRRYTEQEAQWLKSNISRYSWGELPNAFNAYFGTCVSKSSVEHFCIRNGINHGRKHEQGFEKGKRNSFSKTSPIGTERIDKRGRVLVKVSDDVCTAGNNYKNWKQKNRVVWENHYGALSNDDLIIHLDNDKTNCSIDNLYKTNREVNMVMSSFGWFFSDKEMTLAAIKCCELFCEIKKEEL